jgi:hypothetical protein
MEQKSSKWWRRVSAPTVIGWLSVCLLTGAYGHMLDERWQQLWAEMGTLGLAAAVGLGSIDRLRAMRMKRLRDLAMQARFEFGLDRLHQHNATIDSINAAVRTLAQQASQQSRGKLGTAQRNRRRDQLELLAGYPLEIVPVDERGETSVLMPPLTGELQQISSRVVLFEHLEVVPTRTVMLNFSAGNRRLSFVVEVNWTQKVDEAFSSGGTILAVGTPLQEPECEPTEVPREVSCR